MLHDFAGAWPLFREAFLAGWLLAGLLGLVGVLVVARDQIFIGAAVSQASALGIALALALGDLLDAGAWLDSDAVLAVLAVLASTMAALATTRSAREGRGSREARTGWVYLFGASAAVLIVFYSPHGLEEIHRLQSSSIIGATRYDVWVAAGLLVAGGVTVAAASRALLLLAVDPLMASAVGLRVPRWEALISCAVGLVVGIAIPIAGVLYAFGCLVLPAMVARNLCREMRPMFAVAPLVAVGSAVGAFVVAHRYDLPPGQATVALLCLLVAASGLRPRPR